MQDEAWQTVKVILETNIKLYMEKLMNKLQEMVLW